MAIEWVARAQKPIVEIGGRPIPGCDLLALVNELDMLIEASGESVLAFIAPDKFVDYCCYGFYKYPWAIEAFLDVWGIERAPDGARQSLWLQGLVFGYTPLAIQEFIWSACGAQETSSHLDPCSSLSHRCRVGIYGSLAAYLRRIEMPGAPPRA